MFSGGSGCIVVVGITAVMIGGPTLLRGEGMGDSFSVSGRPIRLRGEGMGDSFSVSGRPMRLRGEGMGDSFSVSGRPMRLRGEGMGDSGGLSVEIRGGPILLLGEGIVESVANELSTSVGKGCGGVSCLGRIGPSPITIGDDRRRLLRRFGVATESGTKSEGTGSGT